MRRPHQVGAGAAAGKHCRSARCGSVWKVQPTVADVLRRRRDLSWWAMRLSQTALLVLFASQVLVSTSALLPSPAVARDRIVSCVIEVEGKTYLDGPCNFSPEKDGSFSIGTGDEAHATPFFAYVNKNDDGTAEAFWNEDAGIKKAQSPLGTVRQHGACWTNARARICAK